MPKQVSFSASSNQFSRNPFCRGELNGRNRADSTDTLAPSLVRRQSLAQFTHTSSRRIVSVLSALEFGPQVTAERSRMCALLAEESGARKRSVRWMKRGLVMSRRLLPLVLISLVLSACGGGGGGVVSSTGTVTGLVFNFDANNTPVAGASARISSGTSSTISGADGRYTLSSVPAGVQTLVASASGFPAVQRQVSVPAQGSATLNFGLTALGNPGLAGPSSYQGGTLTVNITSQGQSAIFAAAIAPQDVDGGTYSLQAVALSYFRTWPTSGAPRVTGIISSQKADPLSPRL